MQLLDMNERPLSGGDMMAANVRSWVIASGAFVGRRIHLKDMRRACEVLVKHAVPGHPPIIMSDTA